MPDGLMHVGEGSALTWLDNKQELIWRLCCGMDMQRLARADLALCCR